MKHCIAFAKVSHIFKDIISVFLFFSMFPLQYFVLYSKKTKTFTFSFLFIMMLLLLLLLSFLCPGLRGIWEKYGKVYPHRCCWLDKHKRIIYRSMLIETVRLSPKLFCLQATSLRNLIVIIWFAVAMGKNGFPTTLKTELYTIIISPLEIKIQKCFASLRNMPINRFRGWR